MLIRVFTGGTCHLVCFDMKRLIIQIATQENRQRIEKGTQDMTCNENSINLGVTGPRLIKEDR